MKWLKYIGAVICVALAVGTLPSVLFIAKGLVISQVDEPVYFLGKLFVYVVMIIVLVVISTKLFRSARR